MIQLAYEFGINRLGIPVYFSNIEIAKYTVEDTVKSNGYEIETKDDESIIGLPREFFDHCIVNEHECSEKIFHVHLKYVTIPDRMDEYGITFGNERTDVGYPVYDLDYAMSDYDYEYLRPFLFTNIFSEYKNLWKKCSIEGNKYGGTCRVKKGLYKEYRRNEYINRNFDDSDPEHFKKGLKEVEALEEPDNGLYF